MKIILKLLSLMVIAASLAGCGGTEEIEQALNEELNPNNNSNPPPPAPSGDSFSLSGNTVKGVIANGVVNVYDTADTTTIVFTATDRTAADGSYSLTIPADAEFDGELVLVEVVAADDDSSTMKCDLAAGCNVAGTAHAFGDTITLPAGFSMQSIISAPADGESETVYINALANLVAELALENGAVDADDLADANQLISDVFDIDAEEFAKIPGIDLTQDVSTASEEEQKVAVVGAAILDQGLARDDGSINAALDAITDDIVSANGSAEREEELNDLAEDVFESALDLSQSDEIEGLDDDLVLELVVNELEAELGNIDIDGETSPSANLEGVEQAKAYIADLRTLMAALEADEIATGVDPFTAVIEQTAEVTGEDIELGLTGVSAAAAAIIQAAQYWLEDNELEEFYSQQGFLVTIEPGANSGDANFSVDESHESGANIQLAGTLTDSSVVIEEGYDETTGQYNFSSNADMNLQIAGEFSSTGASISVNDLSISIEGLAESNSESYPLQSPGANTDCDPITQECPPDYEEQGMTQVGEIEVAMDAIMTVNNGLGMESIFSGRLGFSANQLVETRLLQEFYSGAQFQQPCGDNMESCPENPYISIIEDSQISFDSASLRAAGDLSSNGETIGLTLVVDLQNTLAADSEIEFEPGEYLAGQFYLVVNTSIIGIGDSDGVEITLSGNKLTGNDIEGSIEIAYGGRQFTLSIPLTDIEELDALSTLMIENQDSLIINLNADENGEISGTITDADGLQLATIEERDGGLVVVYSDETIESLG